MTDPEGYVTAQAHVEFDGYFPSEATGLVTTSTGPEIEPPQSNTEYCKTKSTMPLEVWIACNSIIQNQQVVVSYEFFFFCSNIAKDFILLGNDAASAGNLISILRQCTVLIW